MGKKLSLEELKGKVATSNFEYKNDVLFYLDDYSELANELDECTDDYIENMWLLNCATTFIKERYGVNVLKEFHKFRETYTLEQFKERIGK